MDGLMYQWATQWVINFIQIVFMWKFMVAEYLYAAYNMRNEIFNV